MKPRLLIPTFFIVSTSLASAAVTNVTIGATAGTNTSEIRDENGIPVPSGSLGVLLIDTGSSGILDPLQPGTFVEGSFFGSSDDFVASIFSTSEPFGVSSASVNLINYSEVALDAGDRFFILWFPGNASSNATIVASQSYGAVSRITPPENNWIVPMSGEDVNGLSVDGTLATFQVVPEPETFALIAGVAMLGFVAVRRRLKA